jgi:hypothetical protein
MRGFLYICGAYTHLGVLPGFDTVGLGDCNADGVVVGIARAFIGSADHAFVWQAGVLRDLDSLVAGAVEVTEGTGLAMDGTVVSQAQLQGQVVAIVLDPFYVPGDAVADCTIDVDDLILVILEWGNSVSTADVTGDGIVDVDDLVLVIANWMF